MPGCQVRYRVIEGPQAGFLPYNAGDGGVTTDSSGRAAITMVQLTPVQARNRVAVEITRAEAEAGLPAGGTQACGRP